MDTDVDKQVSILRRLAPKIHAMVIQASENRFYPFVQHWDVNTLDVELHVGMNGFKVASVVTQKTSGQLIYQLPTLKQKARYQVSFKSK